eukprot:jgi/Mesvir1/21944/Mv06345-RA.1
MRTCKRKNLSLELVGLWTILALLTRGTLGDPTYEGFLQGQQETDITVQGERPTHALQREQRSVEGLAIDATGEPGAAARTWLLGGGGMPVKVGTRRQLLQKPYPKATVQFPPYIPPLCKQGPAKAVNQSGMAGYVGGAPVGINAVLPAQQAQRSLHDELDDHVSAAFRQKPATGAGGGGSQGAQEPGPGYWGPTGATPSWATAGTSSTRVSDDSVSTLFDDGRPAADATGGAPPGAGAAAVGAWKVAPGPLRLPGSTSQGLADGVDWSAWGEEAPASAGLTRGGPLVVPHKVPVIAPNGGVDWSAWETHTKATHASLAGEGGELEPLGLGVIGNPRRRSLLETWEADFRKHHLTSQSHRFPLSHIKPERMKQLVPAVAKLLAPPHASSCTSVGVACSDVAVSRVGLRLWDKSLGSCAVVGLAHSLLDTRLGLDIDKHDTVIRFGGAPVESFAPHVGRRTTISFLREVPLSKEDKLTAKEGTDAWTKGDVLAPERFYLSYGIRGTHVGASAGELHLFKGKPYVPMEALAGAEPTKRGMALYELLKEHVELASKDSKLEELKPTTGMKLVLTLHMSGLCERIDLYGFSKSGAGHYFEGVSHANRDARSAMLETHVPGLEYFIYNVAMANGMLCIY